MKVQEFLKTNSLNELAKQHGVYASFDKEFTKFSLNYDMIESKNSDDLACECRGLILGFSSNFTKKQDILDNLLTNTQVLARPMRRFFNFGQQEAVIDWESKLSVQEKLDGTCCICYFDFNKNKWFVATRSVPEADICMDSEITFSELFAMALQEQFNMSFDNFTSKLDIDFTYVFELCTPYNRIIVDYEVCSITQLAKIAKDGTESIPDLDFVPRPKAYEFSNINQLLDLINSFNPVEHEGCVVVDENFNRIKIKNQQYVSFNKAAFSISKSPRAMIETILNGNEDDLCGFLSAKQQRTIYAYKHGIICCMKEHDEKYKEFADAAKISGDNAKAFASIINVQNKYYHAYMFDRYRNRCDSMKDWIFKQKKVTGWSDTLLDKMLEFAKSFGENEFTAINNTDRISI